MRVSTNDFNDLQKVLININSNKNILINTEKIKVVWDGNGCVVIECSVLCIVESGIF